MSTGNNTLSFQSVTYLTQRPEQLRQFYQEAFGVGSLLKFEEASLPTERMAAGLFHTAFLFSSRQDLAIALLRLDALGIPVEGASDHDVSEAIYLSDPEGNGIEIYADRPKEAWRFEDGEVTMGTYYLNLKDLVAQAPVTAREAARQWGGGPLELFSTPPEQSGSEALAEPAERASSFNGALSSSAPPSIGHVHLRALDLEQSEAFWRDQVGLQVTTRYPGLAAFLSVGGYHHHIGVNRFGPWVPASPDAAGLRHIEIAGTPGSGLAAGEFESPEGVLVSVHLS